MSNEALEALAEILEGRDRFILVTLPNSMRRATYDTLYEEVERVAKAADIDCGLVGAWRIGGGDG